MAHHHRYIHFDAERGITINFPRLSDNRYASVYIIDNDHYVVDIIYEPGKYKIKGDTRFLYVIVRIQVKDPFDKKEIKMINEFQDKFIVTSKTNEEFPSFQWDKKSLDAQRAIYEKESEKYSSWKGMMGRKGEVNEKTRHVAAAAAWGLFPEKDAIYLNYKPGLSNDKCYTATYSVPDNDGFWSITVYGDDGFMKSNHNVINASNVKLNKDGTFTVFYGSKKLCGDKPNRVDIPEGWNFLFRIYRPGKSVLAGKFEIKDVVEVK